MELEEEIREFLIECNENLLNLDREVVLLEQSPADAKLIASVFRTIHTIKGTCGFFGFGILGAVSHVAENLLDQVRGGKRALTSTLISLLLEAVDAIKAMLATIELNGSEGTDCYEDLRERLKQAYVDVPVDVQDAASPSTKKFIATPTDETVSKTDINIEEGATRSGRLSRDCEVVKQAVVDLGGDDTSESDECIGLLSPTSCAGVYPSETSTDVVPPKSSVVVDSTIRVDVGLLDKLMNLVGELVLARNQLLQGTSGHDAVLIRTVQRLNVITSELQEGVLKTRMQPIGVVWNKLPRVIRDLATECGKKIQIVMEGAETELDKTIIEAIKDPLTHIARNSCDHGIERPDVRIQMGKRAEGVILLRAYHEGGHVNIEISDDGAGLDPEKLKSRALQKGLIRPDQAMVMTEREAVHLVFLPGFSTAEQVTNISGRGVGMDVVKTNIQKIGGVVDIYNRPGAPGSAVRIKIPLTLAIIPGLLIEAYADRAGPETGTAGRSVGEHRFVIPQANLLELVRLEAVEIANQIEYVNGAPVYRRRGHLLPLAYLNRVLDMEGAVFPASGVVNIIVLQAEDRPFGLVVDSILDTQEIVVKPLGKRLKGLSSYLGATIMGDGRVALILDVPGLARLAGIVSQARDVKRPVVAEIETVQKQTFLIFRAGRFTRLAVPLSLVARLEQFPSRNIEIASNRAVLHYREEILPLLLLRPLLESSEPGSNQWMSGGLDSAEHIQVVVFGEAGGRIGLVVDQIVDIIDEAVTFRQNSSHPGLLGSAVIGGNITDLIDLQALLELSGQNPLGCGIRANDQKTYRLLIVDRSALQRNMLSNYLSMRGYETLEASGVTEAIEILAVKQRMWGSPAASGQDRCQGKIDLIVTSVDLGSETGFDLLQAINAHEPLCNIPVVATLPPGAEVCPSPLPDQPDLSFDAVDQSGDRVQLLRIILTTLSKHSKHGIPFPEVSQ